MNNKNKKSKKIRFWLSLIVVFLGAFLIGFVYKQIAISASGNTSVPVPSGWTSTTRGMNTYDNNGWPTIAHYEKNGVLLTVKALKMWFPHATSSTEHSGQYCKNANGDYSQQFDEDKIIDDGDNFFWNKVGRGRGSPTDLAECDPDGSWKIGDTGTYKVYIWTWHKRIQSGNPYNLYAVTQYIVTGPYDTSAEKKSLDNAGAEINSFTTKNKISISAVAGETGPVTNSPPSSSSTTQKLSAGANGVNTPVTANNTNNTPREAAKIGVSFGTASGGAGMAITWGGYISSIYSYSVGIGGTLATLVIIYAGILYMTSQGESSKLQAAKDYFIGAITGFVLLLLMGLVLGFLGVPSYGT